MSRLPFSFDPAALEELLSGRRRGLAATAFRWLLASAELPYGLAVGYRNRRLDQGRGVQRVEVPVISVGNVTTGGTGKTPMVAFLARWLRHRGVRVALISRGYGAEHGGSNDEALELEQRLPDVPHLQNPDRCAAAAIAIQELATQLIILDDGFQHRRMARDLDVVLVDALQPFGYGHLLPRGKLREPLKGLARAQVICLSRADAVDPARRRELLEQLRGYAPAAIQLQLAHRPEAWRAADGRTAPLEQLHGHRVAAFCGIGNPDGFRHSLRTCGCQLEQLKVFPDHHAYTRDDVTQLAEWAKSSGVDAIVCTEKDLVKLDKTRLGSVPLWALSIGLHVLEGLPELEQTLAKLAERALQIDALSPDDSCP